MASEPISSSRLLAVVLLGSKRLSTSVGPSAKRVLTTRVALEAGGLLRCLLRPIGYLAFVTAIAALSVAACLLGERNELGFFASRLARTIWRYPEVTRHGVQVAWLVWAALVAAAVSDSTPWDERGLGALALFVLGRRFIKGHLADR